MQASQCSRMPSHHPSSNPTQFHLSWFWGKKLLLSRWALWSFLKHRYYEIKVPRQTGSSWAVCWCWYGAHLGGATPLGCHLHRCPSKMIPLEGWLTKLKLQHEGCHSHFWHVVFSLGRHRYHGLQNGWTLFRQHCREQQRPFRGSYRISCSLCVVQTLTTQCSWLQCRDPRVSWFCADCSRRRLLTHRLWALVPTLPRSPFWAGLDKWEHRKKPEWPRAIIEQPALVSMSPCMGVTMYMKHSLFRSWLSIVSLRDSAPWSPCYVEGPNPSLMLQSHYQLPQWRWMWKHQVWTAYQHWMI